MDKFFPYKDLSYKIVGLLYKVRSAYGNSQKEIIYQNALVEELEEAKIPYKREVDISIISSKTKKRLGNYRADFLIDNKIILEIKAIKFTFNKLEQQVFSYLKSTPYEIAYLANFGSPQFYFKRYILTNNRKSVDSVSPKSVDSVSPKSVPSVSLGFTFIELIVVIMLVAALITILLGLLNPIKQIQKSRDVKRKTDLSTLQKVFEDFYNDKNHFPLAGDVCFDAASSPRIDIYGKTACFCHICDRSFSPYLNTLPCDSQSFQKGYLYDFDCSQTPQNPQWYRIYTKLSIAADPDIITVGCSGGCGPILNSAYNYGVSSSNIGLEKTANCPALGILCRDTHGDCNICSPDENCLNLESCDQSEGFFTDVNCSSRCLLPREE